MPRVGEAGKQVLVRGVGRVEVAPDYAWISFDVRAHERSAEDALDSVARRCGDLDALLDGLGPAVSNRVTTSLSVAPHYRGPYDKRVQDGWNASRSISCEVRDLSVLGALLHDAVAAAKPEVGGPSWRLDDGNAAHDEARGEAAADARRRADAYAAALGLRLGGVAWLAEPGLRLTRGGDYGGDIMVSASPAPMAQGRGEEESAQVVEVTAERISVSATVEAAFFLEE